jgi:hypothetical protein
MAAGITLNLMFTGKLIRVADMFHNTIKNIKNDNRGWKLQVFLGMILASSYYYCYVDRGAFNEVSVFLSRLSIMGYALIGILLGFGSGLCGDGCTSVFFCGLPRLGKRFIVESVVIVLSAMSIANIIKNVRLPDLIVKPNFIKLSEDLNFDAKHYIVFGLAAGLVVFYCLYLMVKNRKSELKEFSISVVSGFLLGLGIILSGMNKPSKVLGLLSFNNFEDSELLISFGVVIFANFLSFYYIYDNYTSFPIWSSNLDREDSSNVKLRGVLGCILFGIGWGICGIDPSVAILTLHIYIPHLALFLVCFFVGQEVATKVD